MSRKRTPKDDVKNTGRFFSLGCVTSHALTEVHCHGHLISPFLRRGRFTCSSAGHFKHATRGPREEQQPQIVPQTHHILKLPKCQQELLLAFTERKKTNVRREGTQFRKDYCETNNPRFPKDPKKTLLYSHPIIANCLQPHRL